MSKDVEKSRFKTVIGPLYCAVGGIFVMVALALAINVSLSDPLRFLVWGGLLFAAPVGFFFLALGLRAILQERSS